MGLRRPLSAALFALLLPALARADDLFQLTARSAAGNQQATASGSSVLDLASDLIKAQSEFEPLDNQAFNATLRYGRIRDAIQFQRNAAGTSATLSIPSTGFSRTFTGATERQVLDKVEDFLLKQGAREYAKFLRGVNERSLLGVADGNPLAATALLAEASFSKFGIQRTPFDTGGLADATPAGGGLRFDFGGGVADTDDGDGYYLSGALSGMLRFNDHVGLSLASPFTYRDVEGAQIFHGGFEAAVPILLTAPQFGRGLTWQLTPAFLAGASGSEDLAAGGTFLGGGITSCLVVPFGQSTAITIGNGIYFFEGFPIHVGEYEFDTDLSQQVLKNGIKLTQSLAGGGAFVDVGVTYTASPRWTATSPPPPPSASASAPPPACASPTRATSARATTPTAGR